MSVPTQELADSLQPGARTVSRSSCGTWSRRRRETRSTSSCRRTCRCRPCSLVSPMCAPGSSRASPSATRASRSTSRPATCSRTRRRCTRPRPPSSPSPSRWHPSGDCPRTSARRTSTGGHPSSRESLADRRILLLGYGGVGKAVAARLAPFEVELTVVASRARVEDGMPVHGVDELAELLPSAEILIVTLPGGESTRHIVDDGVAVGASRRRAPRERRTRCPHRHRRTRRPRRPRAPAVGTGRHRSRAAARGPSAVEPARVAHGAPRRRRIQRDEAAHGSAHPQPDRTDAGAASRR